MTSPRSDLTVSSLTNSAPARGQVTLARLLCRRVREAGDGLLARFVTRRSLDWSPLRAGLHALRNIHA